MKHGHVHSHTRRRTHPALPAGVKGEGQSSWYERGEDLFNDSVKRAGGGLGREGKESLSKSQSKGPDQTEGKSSLYAGQLPFVQLEPHTLSHTQQEK